MKARIALVHDWLTGMRGGEKVLEALCERFPDAELFTLLHRRGQVSPTIERRPIHVSPLQHLPQVHRYYRYCLPLFPWAIEQLDLDGFDFVLSVSHCAAKSVIRPPSARHLCYCLTPMRYAWDQYDAYFNQARVGALRAHLAAPVMRHLARWDLATAGRPDRYVAISHYVASRIRRYYNRQASVVYPPVDTDFFCPDGSPSEGFALVVSALVPYKRIELAVDACERARVPLLIVGDGPERRTLERGASERTRFLGRVSDDRVRDLYRRASLVILPGEEDFGIVPLEAQACGVPVVALGRGGARETVIDGDTGELVDEPVPELFAQAIARVRARSFDRVAIRQHAERFGRVRFADQMQALVHDTLSSGPES